MVSLDIDNMVVFDVPCDRDQGTYKTSAGHEHTAICESFSTSASVVKNRAEDQEPNQDRYVLGTVCDADSESAMLSDDDQSE